MSSPGAPAGNNSFRESPNNYNNVFANGFVVMTESSGVHCDVLLGAVV